MPFDPQTIAQVEFAVALRKGEHPCYGVPADPKVKALLAAMLTDTLLGLEKIEDGGDIEYGEQYPTLANLRLPADDPTIVTAMELFDAQNLQQSAQALSEPSGIDYYFARFRDAAGERCMGVRTATQFKGSVDKHMMFWLDGQLTVVPNRVFRLDADFDFLVYADHVRVYRPAMFMRVAKVDEVLAAKAPEHFQQFADQLPLVDLAGCVDAMTKKTRCQRLLASVRKHPWIATITVQALSERCYENGIDFTTANGKLVPAPEQAEAFLQLVDGRRYPHPFAGERLLATSRRKVPQK